MAIAFGQQRIGALFGAWIYELERAFRPRRRRMRTLMAPGLLDPATGTSARPKRRGERIVVVLPAERAFSTAVPLPLSAMTRIGAVLRHQVLADWPLASTAPEWDASLCRNVAGLSADLVMVRGTEAATARREAEQAGFRVARLDVAGPSGTPRGLALGLGTKPADALQAPRRRVARVAAAFYALAALAGTGLWWQGAEADAASERALVQAREAARPVLEIRAEMAASRATLDALRKDVSAHIPTGAVLAEISGALPKSASLSAIEIDGGSVALSGVAADPTSVLTVLDATHLLAQGKFVAPIRRDLTTGRDRFTLGFQIAAPENRP